MNLTKEDWIDWKSNHVTKAFEEVLKERISDTAEILCNTAGLNSDSDNFYRGFLKGQQEVLDFRVDFPGDEDE